MKKIAVYPGTFDPLTLGHLDVIQAGAKLFDEVIVAILENPQKKPMFSEEERMAMLVETLKENGLGNVRVLSFHGLTVELARRERAICIIRGLRLMTDFEAELVLSFNNLILAPEIQTIFIPPRKEHIHISSSVVRELLHFGRTDLEGYVPSAVLVHLRRSK